QFFADVAVVTALQAQGLHCVPLIGNLDQASRRDAVVAAAQTKSGKDQMRCAAGTVGVAFAIDNIEIALLSHLETEPDPIAGVQSRGRLQPLRDEFSGVRNLRILNQQAWRAVGFTCWSKPPHREADDRFRGAWPRRRTRGATDHWRSG